MRFRAEAPEALADFLVGEVCGFMSIKRDGTFRFRVGREFTRRSSTLEDEVGWFFCALLRAAFRFLSISVDGSSVIVVVLDLRRLRDDSEPLVPPG